MYISTVINSKMFKNKTCHIVNTLKSTKVITNMVKETNLLLILFLCEKLLNETLQITVHFIDKEVDKEVLGFPWNGLYFWNAY